MSSLEQRRLTQQHLARETTADCQPAWQLPQQLPLPHYSCALARLHVQTTILSIVQVMLILQ